MIFTMIKSVVITDVLLTLYFQRLIYLIQVLIPYQSVYHILLECPIATALFKKDWYDFTSCNNVIEFCIIQMLLQCYMSQNHYLSQLRHIAGGPNVICRNCYMSL